MAPKCRALRRDAGRPRHRSGLGDSGRVGEPAGIENAVRNTLTRNYLHRRWWLNDPDCQLVRDTSDLTAAEREAFATLVAATGGVNIFSDRLAEIGFGRPAAA